MSFQVTVSDIYMYFSCTYMSDLVSLLVGFFWGEGRGGEWYHFRYNINLCQASHTQYRTGEMSGTKQTMMYVKSCLDSLRK